MTQRGKRPVSADLEALAAAVRAADAAGESGKTVEDVLRGVMADPEDAVYVAMQRALRIVPPVLSARQGAGVRAAVGGAWLDGMLAGYALRRAHEETGGKEA